MPAHYPELTVLITSYNAGATISQCLESLRRQQTSHSFEILVVDSSTDGTSELVKRDFPEVRIHYSPYRMYPGDARNAGMGMSHAPIIAFLDADCRVAGNWIDKVIEAHSHPYGVAAGSIDNGDPGTLSGWTYLFCEFSLWLPSCRPRLIDEGAGCSLSMKRAAYERFGPFIEQTYCSDTAFHWNMQQAGQQVLFYPEIRIYHNYNQRPFVLFHHILKHRHAFAAVRTRHFKLSRLGRGWSVVQLPFHPFMLLGAVAWRLRRSPRLIPRFALVAPLVFLGFCARVLGEARGYWETDAG